MAYSEAAPAFPIWFPFVFAGMWVLVNFYLADKSDWRLLARKYKTPIVPDGQRLRRQVYQVGSVPENGVTRLVISSRGLYLAPFVIFRIGRTPLLIPWSAVTGVKRGRTLWRTWYSLNIDGLTLIKVGQDAFDAMRVYVPPPVDAAA